MLIAGKSKIRLNDIVVALLKQGINKVSWKIEEDNNVFVVKHNGKKYYGCTMEECLFEILKEEMKWNKK